MPLAWAMAVLEVVEPGGDGLLAGRFAIGDVERSDPPDGSDLATKLDLCDAGHLADADWVSRP